MSAGGFIVWPRGENERGFLQAGGQRRTGAWLWMVLKANWAPGMQDIDEAGKSHLIRLERGQLCATDGYLAKVWEWDRSSVRRFIGGLKERSMVATASDQSLRVVTICDYERFQEFRSAADHRATKPRPTRDHKQDSRTPKGTGDSHSAPRNGPGGDAFASGLGMGSCEIPIPTMRDRLMADGMPLLKALMGKDQRATRSYMGRLLKFAEDDGQRVMDALHDCARVQPICVRTWLMQAVRPRRGPKSDAGLDWMDGMVGPDGSFTSDGITS